MSALVVCGLLLGACGGSSPRHDPTTESTVSMSGCADVVEVEVTGDGPYRFDVTVASADTGWDKYADEWRIETEDGEILGTRELLHPHVDEQPFTRSLSGVDVDAPLDVVVAARDSIAGYCGQAITVTVGG